MARPLKKGLDYYPHDVDMHHNPKIEKLMYDYKSILPYAIFSYLLSRIYKVSYYFEYKEEDTFLIAREVYADVDDIIKVIHSFVEVGLFDKEMYEKEHVLTSVGIQKCYAEIQKHYRHKTGIDKYNLLPANYLDDDSATDSNVSATKTGISSAKTGIPSAISTQKEKKGNKNKTKEEKSKEDVSSSSTCVPVVTTNVVAFDFETELRKLRADESWIWESGKLFKLPPDCIIALLEKFSTYCKSADKTEHKDSKDLKDHFVKWMDYEIKNNTNIGGPNNEGITTGRYLNQIEQRKSEKGKRLADYSAVACRFLNGNYEIQNPTSIDYSSIPS